MKINNKRIIVTGAGAGIGRELVLQLISRGAYVAALDINEENLKLLEKDVNNKERLSIHVVNVASEESINKFKKEYYKQHPVIDGLINNAGIIQPFTNFDKLEMDIIDRVMNVNFYGPLKLTKLFLNEMLEREEAHIVNISSMGGFFPFPGQTIYGASKSALKLFTEGLYSELMKTNVKVTIVFPGAINTNIAGNSNVKTEQNNTSKLKMLSASSAANIIIRGIENNKFQLYVGTDSKFMNFIYKLNPKASIRYIKNKMNNIN